ncbi:hypothetical protein RHGRI_012003 [Rhododendron griersonianum]|uniref:Reverse transcriptase zinc-binding domain-containing protein n=2 Tax=Rhododendron TaxID=4346 RepID=A0AAV6KQD0_9ERIC|nr:hypothetical protein RHGRI_012003 [Rhododendron griersonianum]
MKIVSVLPRIVISHLPHVARCSRLMPSHGPRHQKNTPSHFADGVNHEENPPLHTSSGISLSAQLPPPGSGDHLLRPPLETKLLEGKVYGSLARAGKGFPEISQFGILDWFGKCSITKNAEESAEHFLLHCNAAWRACSRIIDLWHMQQWLCQIHITPHVMLAGLLIQNERPGEESDADSSRETSSDGGSECGAERGTNHAQGAWSQRNNMRAIAQSFNRLSADKGEISDPPGFLLFEYFDSAPPFSREPLADKASRFLFPRKFACFSLNALLPS